nr:hypothetical protein [Pseudomonas sp. CC6-YY-74]
MWQELDVAFCPLLVLEGTLSFLCPRFGVGQPHSLQGCRIDDCD